MVTGWLIAHLHLPYLGDSLRLRAGWVVEDYTRSLNRLNTRGRNCKGGREEKEKGVEEMKRAGVLTSTMLWRMIKDMVTALPPSVWGLD